MFVLWTMKGNYSTITIINLWIQVTYATRAAGGIIYSLSVPFLFIFGRTVRTDYCKYLYSVKSGWSQITCKWRKIFILRFYTVGSLYSCQFWRVYFKKLQRLTNFVPKLPYIESGSSKNQGGFQNLKFKTNLEHPWTFIVVIWKYA